MIGPENPNYKNLKTSATNLNEASTMKEFMAIHPIIRAMKEKEKEEVLSEESKKSNSP